MWQLVFAGDLVTGYEHREVIPNLARLLGTEEPLIERTLFTNQTVVFKEVENEEQAIAWRDRFAAAGAILVIVPEDARELAWPYVGHKLRVTYLHEPTAASLKLRIPYLRQRNLAWVVLLLIILSSIALLVVANWLFNL